MEKLKLEEIVNISIGKTPSRSEKSYWDKEKNTKNIWLSIADLNLAKKGFIDNSKEYLSDAGAALFKSVPANTLIMSFKLSIGKLAFTSCELRTNEAIAALQIKNKNKITKEYLRYFLSSLNWDKIAGDDVKVKGKTLNKAKLKELQILLPTLVEQQSIVTKLDAAFAKIDKSISITKKKKKEVEVLFNSILTITIESENTPLETMSLDELANFLDYRGKTPLKTENGVRLLTAKNVRMGYIKSEPKEYISEEEYKVRMTRGFPKLGDVVFTTEAPLGLVAQIKDESFALGQRLITFQIKNRVIQNSYLKYALMSSRYQQEIYKNGTGATVKGIKASLLKKIKISFPSSIDEQNNRVKKLELAEEKKNHLTSIYSLKLDELYKLKSAILANKLQNETI